MIFNKNYLTDSVKQLLNKKLQVQGYVRLQHVKDEWDAQKLPEAIQGWAQFEGTRKF